MSKIMSRRQALKRITAAYPLILSSRMFGASSPANRIAIGMIGMGRQAVYANLKPFLVSEDTKVLAVSDVDRWRLDTAKKLVDKHYGNADCAACGDWREIIARKDIDAVMISTPDHWHVPIALAAVRAGKHVSCEKPLTLSISEGRLLADEAKKRGVAFRTDSECRSHPSMRAAAELVVNGYLGKLKHIEASVPTGDVAGGNPEPMPVPEGLDYEMWAGPAPLEPYTEDRVHPRESYGRPGWMRCRNTCEGMITNWGTHLLDVAQLAHGTERTGPVEVEGTGKYPEVGSGLWNVLLSFHAKLRFADGVEVDYHTGEAPFVRFEGDEGWVQSTWMPGGGLKEGLTANSDSLLSLTLKESDIHLPARMDKEDFIYGIKMGKPTMADAEIGHRTCSLGQLAHIAIQTGRLLRWNPDHERFTEDDAANALLSRPIRGDWMRQT